MSDFDTELLKLVSAIDTYLQKHGDEESKLNIKNILEIAKNLKDIPLPTEEPKTRPPLVPKGMSPMQAILDYNGEDIPRYASSVLFQLLKEDKPDRYKQLLMPEFDKEMSIEEVTKKSNELYTEIKNWFTEKLTKEVIDVLNTYIEKENLTIQHVNSWNVLKIQSENNYIYMLKRQLYLYLLEKTN